MPARDTWKTQTKPCVHQDPEAPQRLTRPAFECLSVFCGSMGLQWPATWKGALAAADLGHLACGISSLEGCAISSTTELLSRQHTNCRTIISKKFSHC